ncbi:hypothetical protein AGR2A_Cc140073 [Agrobacterium genomosp. 2 str. CFBP 5494]|uniref:Uncharacterized protein n=1 Tax=Agrobacterium genomosp. 2 str. CFBP 5494 TaxID=1183436 RepID=A0A9W5AZV6_9HYPH|nr:hypothetical protein AGR2A_Cc140073 [Agrobacterium genomosp. 2 str. CFBP 5494]
MGETKTAGPDWNAVIDRMNAETEKLDANVRQWQRDDAKTLNRLMGAVGDLRRAERGFGRHDPHPNEPLSLEQAACLPVLGGELFHNASLSVPGPNVSAKTLRTAVNAGLLGTTNTSSKNKTTLAQIEEWLEACRSKNTTDRTSSNVTPATTRPAASLTVVPSSSPTGKPVTTQDAVSAILKRLK